jgi:FdhD protein
MSQTSVPDPAVILPDPAAVAPGATAAVRVRVAADLESRERTDWLAVEEPLEIRAGGPGQPPVSVAVTMRTPGHDFELAVGFLYTEGLIKSRDELAASAVALLRRAGPPGDRACNIARVRLSGPFDGSSLKRNFFATSSCGVCGKATLDQIAVRCPRVGDGPKVGRSVILALPDALRRAQEVFDRTGGLHAAGLFDADGRLIAVREDVGRHNAVDKIVGRGLLDGALPLADRILLVSGRTSFEIVQKAAVAGVPVVCAVSAPSSLAVSAADRLGITLVGFLRGANFNVYTRPERIDPVR